MASSIISISICQSTMPSSPSSTCNFLAHVTLERKSDKKSVLGHVAPISAFRDNSFVQNVIVKQERWSRAMLHKTHHVFVWFGLS